MQQSVMPKKNYSNITKPNEQSEISGMANAWSITGFRLQALILAVLGFVFYVNTIGNGSAFDDKLVITNNEYVQSGFSGIPKILTSETYSSFSEKQHSGNPLAGGRYRPLSVVTFAIEQQFFGTNDITASSQKIDPDYFKKLKTKQESDMHPRHAVNMLLYVLLVVVLLYLFRTTIFPDKPMAAFFSALFFLIHPIHTEVVANVKSCDEILSLLFIALTLLLAFRFEDLKKYKDRILAVLCFFLALLSKEYAMVMIILLPMMLLVFRGYGLKKAFTSILPYLVPLAAYFALRVASVSAASESAGDEIMNNPYLFASVSGKWATILLVLLKYLQLLFCPNHLSADYSYNQIPYTTFADPVVWASILIYGGIILSGVYLLKKRHPLAIAITFYLLFLALVCNVFVNIGAPMGERLVFHSSVGIALALGWMANRLWENRSGKVVSIAVTACIVVLSGYKTVSRNRDWASDATLFLQDVKTCPNSIITNCNAGAAMLDKADAATDTIEKRHDLDIGVGFLNKAISMHPHYMLAYLNRGIIYLRKNEFDHALADCDTVMEYQPQNPAISYLSYTISDHFFKQGMSFGQKGQPEEALKNFKKAAIAMPTDPDIWYNVGYAYYTANQPDSAYRYFARTLSIKPTHPQARNMMNLMHKK